MHQLALECLWAAVILCQESSPAEHALVGDNLGICGIKRGSDQLAEVEFVCGARELLIGELLAVPELEIGEDVLNPVILWVVRHVHDAHDVAVSEMLPCCGGSVAGGVVPQDGDWLVEWCRDSDLVNESDHVLLLLKFLSEIKHELSRRYTSCSDHAARLETSERPLRYGRRLTRHCPCVRLVVRKAEVNLVHIPNLTTLGVGGNDLSAELVGEFGDPLRRI